MTKILGLIGYPLSHSFSKKYFTEKFEKEEISGYRYELFPIEDISEFPDFLDQNPSIIGLNVTIPYKERILEFINNQDDTSKNIGAVNCIKIDTVNDKKVLTGYNTDTYGFEISLRPLLKPIHKKALILGTGGASKAVEYVLKKLNIESRYVSRTPRHNILGYKDLDIDIMKEYKIIINTSPIGMYPDIDNAPSLPYKHISKDHLLYDLIYNPQVTKFMQLGLNQGAIVKNGLDMLYGQAEKAWEIWNK